MDRIAVLLTCFNRKEKTIACLDSLYKIIEDTDADAAFDIYLVDDKSTDGTAEAIKENFPEVNLLIGTGDLYWNRGMHLAWSEASKHDYDFYLWINDDTILKNKALQMLLDNSKTFNDEAIICGVCESAKTGEITYGGYEKTTHKLIPPSGKPQACFYFNGNIVLVPKKVFKVLGNLDPVFNHGIGDYDYGLRAYKKGINKYITGESIGYCERNDLPKWCNPKYTFRQRVKNFYSPLGVVASEQFVFRSRHYGYYKATKNFFSNHLRLIFPSKWVK